MVLGDGPRRCPEAGVFYHASLLEPEILASLISGGVLELPTERIANLLIEAGAAFYAGGTGP